jgi:hypothetical protein
LINLLSSAVNLLNPHSAPGGKPRVNYMESLGNGTLRKDAGLINQE